MIYVLGEKSRAKLKGVHPNMIRVVERAIEITEQDFRVDCGVRTLVEQKALYAQGRTKPGPKVTWTLNSRHLPAADGFGHAVDLVPVPVDWSNLTAFDAVAKAMMAAAKELGIKIRWGADWDSDGKPREKGESDSPHFELD
jgi:peptidoglycan L-alanyl-D-glutamate endopeptidase CwlK